MFSSNWQIIFFFRITKTPEFYCRPIESDFPRNNLTVCVCVPAHTHHVQEGGRRVMVGSRMGAGRFVPKQTVTTNLTLVVSELSLQCCCLLSRSEAGSCHCSVLLHYQPVATIPLLFNAVIV